MLVDPRPYTYEYRKPRLSNPTFQSRNLYDSLYHQNSYQSNDYFTPASRYQPNEKTAVYQPEQLAKVESHLPSKERNRSMEFARSKPLAQQSQDPEKYRSSYRLPAIRETPRVQEILPVVNGGNMNHHIQRRQGMERFKVYERQQKPFNIINCYPREQENNKLRNFPKLTLEDKLIEQGNYRNFQ